MSIENRHIIVNGLRVDIVRKDIKNLHLGVYPPNGRVRVAAPLRVSDDALRLAVIGKLGWIKRQKGKFETQQRQSEPEMVSGESHYFLGRRYRLRVVNHDGHSTVLHHKAGIELHIRRGATAKQRERVLQRWYRKHLKELVLRFVKKWEPIVGVRVADSGIKKMKTKWGSCNAKTGRIWVNLELAKKPVHCLEYIVIHEMAHLVERHHNDRFVDILDRHLPRWRSYRQELNSAPLSHETWGY